MGTTITCPSCGTEFEISDVIFKEIEATIVKEIQDKHNNLLKNLENQHKKALEEEKKKIRTAAQNIRKVYLAGGFYSGWQDKIISGIEGMAFFDARTHNYDDPEKYTDWDLTAIRNADLVFAYFEETNPTGYGLMLEVGFAKALNIPVILVDEKSQKDTEFGKKIGMLHASSSVVFDNFEDGYNHLFMISRM
jgi:nucleoside 2-deoxyribosyltransferase